MYTAFRCPPTVKRLTLLAVLPLILLACSSAEERAQNYLSSAQKYVTANDYAHAEIELKNAIKAKKDFLPAYRELAQVDEHQQHWQELVSVLRTVIELDPKDTDSKIKLARLMLYGNAAAQAQKVISDIDAPENANLEALKAAIAYKLKDPTTAVADANEAIKLDPTNVDAIMLLAADRQQKGDFDGALAMLNTVPSAHADDLGIQLFKVRIFDQQKDLAKEEAQLKNLIAQYPKQLAFQQQLTRFYLEHNRAQDAENLLRSAKDNPDMELELVRLLFATKGAAAARAELTDRIQAGGNVFSFQVALAELDYGQRNYDDSFKLLQQLASDGSSPEHALAAKLKLAQFNLDQKKTDQAEKLVAEILNADGRNAGALKLRATIELNRDQFDPAINDLRTALNDQPRATDLMLLLATAYERTGSIDLAERELTDALKASNYDTTVALAYVGFLQRRGSAQRAEDVLADMAARKPKDVRILSALAQAKLGRQDWAGGQELGQKIKQLGTANAVADQIIGVALGGQNKVDQSIAAFQDALVAAPSAPQPVAALVREYMQSKQPDKAAALLQGILTKEPSNSGALILLGSVQMANHAPDQAVKSFQTAIQKQPKDVNGYRALADFYLAQRDTASALKTLEAGLQQQPDSQPLQMTLAGVYETSGKYDDAIKEYENILVQQPGSLIAANNLASLLVDHKGDKVSIDRAQALVKGLKQSPVAQFKDTIGWVSYRAGDYKDAIPALESAATELPNLAVIHYHLGMGYLASGQNGKAADEFKMALTKNPSPDLLNDINAQLKKTATE
jgi:cellulose synthase operon protein C